MTYRTNAKPRRVRRVDWGAVGARVLAGALDVLLGGWVAWSWFEVCASENWAWSEAEGSEYAGPGASLIGVVLSAFSAALTLSFFGDVLLVAVGGWFLRVRRALKRPVIKDTRL